MNSSYTHFLDKNLHDLIRIYKEHFNLSQNTVIVIQISKDNKISVFPKPLLDLPPPIISEFQCILSRDPSLLEKDRHVITCSSQSTQYPIKEMCVLFIDENFHHCLRGYQEALVNNQFAFEFETFVQKEIIDTKDEDVSLNFKGQWMNQPTQTGKKYLQLCRQALADEDVFSNFRSKLDYQNIIIGGNQDRANLYYQLLLPIPEAVKVCDSVGNPVLNDNGYSTHTLRCLYTIRDIIKHFGSLNGKNIIEIGSGHGALCHMMTVNDVMYKTYTLVDLPIVNQLARKYLEKVGVERGVKYMSSEQIMPRKYDIVISEYCLSELDTQGQMYYMENIMKYCQMAYLAMNIWNNEKKDVFKQRLMKYFSQIDEYPEEPTSNYPNYKWICRK